MKAFLSRMFADVARTLYWFVLGLAMWGAILIPSSYVLGIDLDSPAPWVLGMIFLMEIAHLKSRVHKLEEDATSHQDNGESN